MRSAKLFSLLTSLALVAVITVQVDAQQGQGQGGRGRGGFPGGGFPGGGFGGPGGGGKLGLLRRDEVKKELELLDEQSADIEKLNEELRSRQNADFQNLTEEERQKRRAEFEALTEEERAKRFEERRAEQLALQKEGETKLAEILLPHQMDRLSQIELQQQGVRAFQNEAVVKELGLSDEVKAAIEGSLRASGEKIQALFQSGNREGMFEKMQEIGKSTEEEVLAKLTQSQRDKFAEMKGEPFEMARFGRGPGGPGGPGGQRGRGGNNGQGGGRPQRPAQ